MAPIIRPSLGRVVYYIEHGHVFAAIVVHVEAASSSYPESVNLIFWNKFGEQFKRMRVCHAGDPSTAKTGWFWPAAPKPSAEDMKKLTDKFKAEIERATNKKEPTT